MPELAPQPGPERADSTRWSVLGRFLPRSIRERVFEPAFADLLRASLETSGTGGHSTPFAVRALGTYLGCVPPSLLRVFVVRGKLTRFTRVMGVVAVLVVVLGFVSQWMGYGYG